MNQQKSDTRALSTTEGEDLEELRAPCISEFDLETRKLDARQHAGECLNSKSTNYQITGLTELDSRSMNAGSHPSYVKQGDIKSLIAELTKPDYDVDDPLNLSELAVEKSSTSNNL